MTSTTLAPTTTSGWILPIWSLTVRELVRFVRQRSRLTAAFVQPIIFWVLFGVGLSGSFQMPGANGGEALSYQAYFIPGIAAMIVLFTSIFSSISVIQDRNEGFLQGVLASPAPRTSIVLGKLLGGVVLSVSQAALFIALAVGLQAAGWVDSSGVSLTLGRIVGIGMLLTLMALGMCGLGYFFAWKLDSVQGFHGIMSVLLFPMWLMSGAFFPSEGSGWLKWIIACNPLTYSVAGLRRIMHPEAAQALPSLATCLLATTVFAVACLLVDVRLTRKDLR